MLQKNDLRNGIILLSLIIFSITQCTHIKKVYNSYKKDFTERDSPVPLFEKGLNNWVMEQYSQAESDFINAKKLDSTYAPAVSGLALIAAIKGSDQEAIRLADEAKGMNSEDPYVFIAKALVLETINRKSGSSGAWVSQAEQEYSRAIELNEKSPEPYFHRGHMYKKIFSLPSAIADFENIVGLGTRHVSNAQLQLSLIESIQQAAPQSEIGRKIALSERVTYEEIRQLLKTETVSIAMPGSKPAPTMASDVSDVKEESTEPSMDFAEAGDFKEETIMDTEKASLTQGTQGTKPLLNLTKAYYGSNKYITRGEFAIMVEEMIIGITGHKFLKDRYKGASRSRFLDVQASHPAYSSICTTVERKIMRLREKQLFGPDKPLTGPEALLITKRLKDLGQKSY